MPNKCVCDTGFWGMAGLRGKDLGSVPGGNKPVCDTGFWRVERGR